MLSTLALAITLALGPVSVCSDLGPTATDETLQELYLAGQTFDEFMGAAVRRKALWDGNYARSMEIDQTLVERARAVGGTWRFLVVAVDSCSDSVNTIPYLARLVEMVEGFDMRVVNSRVGRKVMEDHPTPDGRPSTPTVLLLDEQWNERGCFIERPPALRDWILENPEDLNDSDIFERKMAWYDEDAGQQTLEEVLAILESAARAETRCGKQ
ncbi:MAG: thioredoxin family protein [Gemmatimonadetes bacterium]|nr:thioredoxin family protein [Gemmatimonadota bacterium]